MKKSTNPIGTLKEFGGRTYIKTSTGWKYHGSGKGVKAQEHARISNEKTDNDPKKFNVVSDFDQSAIQPSLPSIATGGTPIYMEDRALLRGALKDQKFVVRSYLNQYAEGITGGNRSTLAYSGPNSTGWDPKDKTIKQFISSLKKHQKSKETQKNRGYGSLGTFYGDIQVMTGEQLADFAENEKYYYPRKMSHPEFNQ